MPFRSRDILESSLTVFGDGSDCGG